MSRNHTYHIHIAWTGNLGSGTSGYGAYSRDHEVTAGDPAGADPVAAVGARPERIAGSADPSFRGDPARWNPEQLLTAALAQCHMLAYLHLCAAAGVVVTGYADEAQGSMTQTADGGGHFTEVVLRPQVTVRSADMIEKALGLHGPAHEKCFIAASVNFPVRCAATVVAA